MALPAVLAGAMRAAGAAGGAGGSAAGGAAGSFLGASRAVAQLGQLQGSVNQLGAVSQRSSNLIGSLASAITGKMAEAMTLWIGWVEKAAAPIENLVRMHNPAIADAFGRALKDAYGVIGRLLVPVMQAFTVVARKVGDAMAKMEPALRPAMQAIAQLVTAIGEEFAKTAEKQAPVFEMLAAVVTKVAQAATVLARAFGEVMRTIGGIMRGVANLLGFDGSQHNKDATSHGAGSRQARFVQPKEISDEAIRNALQLGKESQPKKNISDVWQEVHDFKEWAKNRFGVPAGGATRLTADAGKNISKSSEQYTDGALGRAARWAYTRGR